MMSSELTPIDAVPAKPRRANPARPAKRAAAKKASAATQKILPEIEVTPEAVFFEAEAPSETLTEIGVSTAKPKTEAKTGWPSYAFWPMGLTLGLFCLCAYVSNLGFPLVASLGGVLCFGYWRYARAFATPLISMAVLLAWGAITTDPQTLVTAFSSFDAFSKTQWAKTAFQLILLPPLVFAAWRMPARDAHWLMIGVKWVMAALAILMLSESFTGAALYQWISERIYQPIRPDLALVKTSLPTYQLVWVLWPLLMVSVMDAGKRIVWLIFAALIVTPIVMSANAVTLALIGSTAVFFAAKHWPKSWDGPEQVLAMLIAAAIMLFPSFIALLGYTGGIDQLQSHLPASWDARTEIWEQAARKMFEWPLSGWGFDFSRHFDAIPLHPHNVALQSGLELGFVGLILVALIWAQVTLRIGKPYGVAIADEADAEEAEAEGIGAGEGDEDLKPFEAKEAPRLDTRPYMLAALVPYFVFAFMSFGMWQEWFVAMAGVMVTVCLLACRAMEHEQ